jgi:hypothetical protein
MLWIQENWEILVGIVTGVVTVASLIVKLTPTPKDDDFIAKIMAIINALALNKPLNK